MDGLAEWLAAPGYAPAGTAGQVVPPPRSTPDHLAELTGALQTQPLYVGDPGVVGAQRGTWIQGRLVSDSLRSSSSKPGAQLNSKLINETVYRTNGLEVGLIKSQTD